MREAKHYWHDRDAKPYIEGENEYYDKVMNEIVDNALKKFHKEELENTKNKDN